MAVEPDTAGVRFPPPFVYLGALLLGLAAKRIVTLRSFGIDWRLLVATGALLFDAERAQGDEPLRRQPQQQRSQIDEKRREAHTRAVRFDGHAHPPICVLKPASTAGRRYPPSRRALLPA